MADLTALIERLEKADGPDQILDNDIEWELSDWINIGGWWRKHKVTGEQQRYSYKDAPLYTASIDAAVALAERVLPGWFFDHIGNDAMGEDFNMAWVGWTVELSPGMSNGFQGQAKTLPVAICIAVLRALSAQEGKTNG